MEKRLYIAEDRDGKELGRVWAPGPIEAQMSLLAAKKIRIGGPSFWIREVR